METKLKQYLLKLVERDIDNAADNLYRAKANFKNKTAEEMNKKYGQSDSTCQQILDCYKEWHDTACSAKIQLELI